MKCYLFSSSYSFMQFKQLNLKMDNSMIFGIVLLTCSTVALSVNGKGDFKFLDQSCNLDCSKGKNLPCKINLLKRCPLASREPVGLPPNKPDHIAVNRSYKYLESSKICLGQMAVSWIPPADASGKSVTGFLLTIMSLSGPRSFSKECVQFDMSSALWTDNDIRQKHKFTFSCFQPMFGKYKIFLESLPEAGTQDIDKYWNTTVEFKLKFYNTTTEQCEDPKGKWPEVGNSKHQTTVRPISTPNPKLGSPNPQHIRDNTKTNSNQILYIVLGVAGVIAAMISVILFKVVAKPCFKKSDGYVRLPTDDQFEDVHDVGLIDSSDIILNNNSHRVSQERNLEVNHEENPSDYMGDTVMNNIVPGDSISECYIHRNNIQSFDSGFDSCPKCQTDRENCHCQTFNLDYKNTDTKSTVTGNSTIGALTVGGGYV